jgi:DNA-binding MarR family transcriptional regulator
MPAEPDRLYPIVANASADLMRDLRQSASRRRFLNTNSCVRNYVQLRSPSMTDDAANLREQIQDFFRLFGLHEQHRTPCGQPLSVSHAHALMRLLDVDDEAGLRISELGAHLRIDKSNVSRLCARMEEAGHVERRPCPDDGRAKRLWLTQEGREIAARVNDTSLRRFATLLESLSDTPGQIIDSFQSLNDALRDTLEDGQT